MKRNSLQEFEMRQLVPHASGLVAAVLVLGFVAEVHAAVPLGILLQRRGNTFRMPSKPANVDSSATIDTLNKALKALGATDRDYDGHREKAIAHIGAAIHHMEMPNAKGKSNAAVEKAATGKPAAATKTATTPQTASDESLRKAKAILFNVHHQLTEHTASRGQIRADAEIRIAIDEIVAALKPNTTTPAAKAAAAPAASTTTTTTTSTTPGKPAK
jgi:hypothetical protein